MTNDSAQETSQLIEETGSETVIAIVDEIVAGFKDRIMAQEISPYEMAEALAVALSGTIYSLIPPEKRNLAVKESEPVVRKTLKTFNQQVNKKDIMFASQLLASAKISSYVVTHGHRFIRETAKLQEEKSSSQE